MDVDLEREAKQNAAKLVSSNLQRTNNLEQIKQSKKLRLNKEAAGEAMLRTAMQTQLDDVRKGLIHLQTSSTHAQSIRGLIKDIEHELAIIPNLVEKLKRVREESMKHTQLAAAKENLKHIFNVPENVTKTRYYISEGKLLLAHQCLTELENSRDDLLYEIHRLSSANSQDKSMLRNYFSEVEKLSEELGKQLWLIIRLTLNSVRKEPSIIVTALRIIEREERYDSAALTRKESTDFMPPGRPKQWRNMIFKILEEAVNERIVGNQIEERAQNKMWLVRHLEVTRILILDDLKVVKTACVPCFPPEYNIVQQMLRIYHRCLSLHLQELALQLEGNEYVTLLNWVQKYEGPDLMTHPQLNFDLKEEGLLPLLPKHLIDELTNKYLQTIERNYKEWMNNTINREWKDWSSANPPETDDSGHYQTTTPVIVFQMIDQHLQVAKTVDQKLTTRVLILSLDHLATFAKQYKDAVHKYCESHFEDRGQFSSFTPYMIAVANNCVSFVEIAWKFRQKYPSVSNASSDSAFENVLNSFEKLREDTIKFLLHELFLDLDKELVKVGTREWLEGKFSVIENVCLTLEDYVRDYNHLKQRNFDVLKVALETKLAKSYITSILKKKMTFKDHGQREAFGRKFIKEGEVLKIAISKLPNYNTLKLEQKKTSPFDSLPLLAEFLRLKDLSMLFLEVSGLIKKYPDISVDHLTALLNLREDMAKTNVRKQVTDMMSELPQSGTITKTVFSEIDLS
ncbi:exocyst complex component 3-like [Panonychus citri]|uniref:exocyst complex component 3-like n=1 Tax=Panonychus citri TaxID=50023 RepID=UPI0023076062|nr:exocyst complex component 3-like [Panonychus citri]